MKHPSRDGGYTDESRVSLCSCLEGAIFSYFGFLKETGLSAPGCRGTLMNSKFKTIWNALAPRSASATWRAILAGRDLLQKGVKWGIDNGQNVSILLDHWTPSTPLQRLHPLLPIPTKAKVKCLIDEEAGSSNVDSVNAFFRNDIDAEIHAFL